MSSQMSLESVCTLLNLSRVSCAHEPNNCAAILLYDILINLEREKRLVWDAKFRASSVLYYVLRYPVIAFQVFTIFESHITSQVCIPSYIS